MASVAESVYTLPDQSESNDRSGFDLASRLDELTDAFVGASRRSLEWFGRPLEVDNKAAAGFDPVTVADRSIEDLVREVISSRFPDHTIVGEERETILGTADVEWIIDPIDGTRAFITGRPMWGTLVGVSVAGTPIAGWMHLPVLDETYVGFAGTTRRTSQGETVTVSTRAVSRLSDAVLMCTHPSMFETSQERQDFARVESAVRLGRFDGDCANYGLLAAGFGDLVIENQLQPYDIVPLIPIVEGAGGVITDRSGASPLAGGWVIAAATAELHAEAIALLGAGSN